MILELIIDEEFQILIPPLAPEEYQKLKENIIADGCREPLVIWGKIIVDGHNRYKICTESNVPYKTINKEFKDRSDVIEWMLRNQLGRRNLTDFSRNEIALKYQKVIAKKMRERMSIKGKIGADITNGGGGSPDHTPFGLGDLNEKATTQRKELAKIAGTSEGSIQRSKVILEKGTEEQIERARKGGKGNSIGNIVSEIRESTERKTCRECGRKLPFSEFYNKKNICKRCFNNCSSSKDVKGNILRIAEEYKNIKEEDVIGDLYNNEKEMKYTIENLIEEFSINFDTCIEMLTGILEQHKELLVTVENRKKIMVVLEEAEATIGKMKGDYSYE